MTPDLELRQVGKSFGGDDAVADVSLSIARREFIADLRPAGCGKTTTLRMIAGFVKPTSGSILLRGRDITHVPPNRRDIGMVFQSYALFPHMTVTGNVAFGLNCRNLTRDEVRRRAGEALEIVELGQLGGRYPRQLSGGQQQRVALARVLALNPSLLLFDEPLSNLDARLRLQMRDEIRRLQRQIGITALFVTHDQDEAMAIADRIVVLNGGRVEQIGTAQDIYDRPRSRFVADFIGTSNMLRGEFAAGRSGTEFRTEAGLTMHVPRREGAAGAGLLALRPEKIDLLEAHSTAGLAATIVQANLMGAVMEYRIALASGDTLKVTDLRRGDRTAWSQGDAVRALWRDEDLIVIADA